MGYRITIEITDEPGLVINTLQEGESLTPAGEAEYAPGDRRAVVTRLLDYFDDCAAEPPIYFRAGDIGRAIGINGSEAGKLMSEVIPVAPTRRKGYSAKLVYAYLDERLAEYNAERNAAINGSAPAGDDKVAMVAVAAAGDDAAAEGVSNE